MSNLLTKPRVGCISYNIGEYTTLDLAKVTEISLKTFGDESMRRLKEIPCDQEVK